MNFAEQLQTLRKAFLITAVLLLSITAGCAGGGVKASASPSAPVSAISSPSASPTPSAAPASDTPAGIDPLKFTPAVEAYIRERNAENTGIGDLTVKISVTYIIGFVDITFSDLTSWSSFDETGKKEFIIELGKALDTIAGDHIYPGTLPKVGTDTTLFSPSGQKLAERTSLGIVFLY